MYYAQALYGESLFPVGEVEDDAGRGSIELSGMPNGPIPCCMCTLWPISELCQVLAGNRQRAQPPWHVTHCMSLVDISYFANGRGLSTVIITSHVPACGVASGTGWANGLLVVALLSTMLCILLLHTVTATEVPEPDDVPRATHQGGQQGQPVEQLAHQHCQHCSSRC